MAADFCHTFVVTIHTVYTVSCLCEDELVDSVMADFTLETVGVIRVVASHDCLIEDGLLAYVAVVAAICTDWGAIREQEEVGVGGDLVVTFCTLEAVDMEKGLAVRGKESY